MDFLDHSTSKELKDSAKAYLFGIKGSPLPEVCKVLGLDISKARLLILSWKSQNKTGDPLFGYLTDPKNASRMERGLPIEHPHFEDIYAGNNKSR
jgi:hypothetical protein